MITGGIFLLFLGLIVFGPKKTIEMAQTVGKLVVQTKRAIGASSDPDEEGNMHSR
jgi:Sec-independent protein translocase protein TatA